MSHRSQTFSSMSTWRNTRWIKRRGNSFIRTMTKYCRHKQVKDNYKVADNLSKVQDEAISRVKTKEGNTYLTSEKATSGWSHAILSVSQKICLRGNSRSDRCKTTRKSSDTFSWKPSYSTRVIDALENPSNVAKKSNITSWRKYSAAMSLLQAFPSKIWDPLSR